MKLIDPQNTSVESWRQGVESRMVVSGVNGAEQLCIFEQWIAPGHGAPTHSHPVEEVLTVREGKASALNNELKYYAPGVGQILNTPMVFSHHKDVEELVNLIQLTPRGLAEISAEVLKLDQHARITSRGTYDRSPAARRAR